MTKSTSQPKLTLAAYNAEIQRQVEMADAMAPELRGEVFDMASGASIQPNNEEIGPAADRHPSTNYQRMIDRAKTYETKAREKRLTEEAASILVKEELGSASAESQDFVMSDEDSVTGREPITIVGQDFIDALADERAADRMGTYPGTSALVQRSTRRLTSKEKNANEARVRGKQWHEHGRNYRQRGQTS